MVLSDVDIRRYIAQGKIKISPELPPEQIGSCLVDFILGNEFNVIDHSRRAHIHSKDFEQLPSASALPHGRRGNKYAGQSLPVASRLAREFKG